MAIRKTSATRSNNVCTTSSFCPQMDAKYSLYAEFLTVNGPPNKVRLNRMLRGNNIFWRI